jgi:hypothetical protein
LSFSSPDLSIEVEDLFKLIKFNEDAGIMIISTNLCNVRNMIQLSDQVFYDVTNLFSGQDPRHSLFPDAFIGIMHGNVLQIDN